MTGGLDATILPYSHLVRQDQLKLALELAYVAPGIGGVLVSGERGTAKSTAVRAFAQMMWGALPVTLPLNATDDRVLGGWRLDALVEGRAVEHIGLLEEASKRGLLYVDEVNLLDDHIINIILDASSTGVLTVQREALDRQRHVDFTLVGTMNPEEGSLRPQLLDRFGLMVAVTIESDPDVRAQILRTVLNMDQARSNPDSVFLRRGRQKDDRQRDLLERARGRLDQVDVPDDVLRLCAEIAGAFQVPGHRGDIVMALAARAFAALNEQDLVRPADVAKIAPLALQHRRQAIGEWTQDDQDTLEKLVAP